MKNLESALAYAKFCNWKVFPLHYYKTFEYEDTGCSCKNGNCKTVAKHPLYPNGQKSASANTHQIRNWWEEYPEANIGVVLGQESGIVMLEVYRDDLEYKHLHLLFQQFGITEGLSFSCKEIFFLLFEYPTFEVRDMQNIMPGISFKCSGFISLPPSEDILNEDCYQWHSEKAITSLPDNFYLSMGLAVTKANIISGHDLIHMTLPKMNWIIPGLLPEGLTVFAGPPKVGKSWMALDICCALSTPGIALQTYSVTVQHKSFYCALEDSNRRLQNRLNTLSRTHSHINYDNLHFATLISKVAEGGVETLENHLLEYPDCKLIVIDTLARFRSNKRPNGTLYDQEYEALSKLHAFAAKHAIALIVVTHTRKQSSNDIFEEITGSTAITGAADCIWMLKKQRGKTDGVLHISGRDVTEQSIAVEFNPETCIWEAQGAAEEYAASEQSKAILAMLRETTEALTPKEIAETIGKTRGSVRTMLHRMLSKGLIVQPQPGRYSVPL